MARQRRRFGVGCLLGIGVMLLLAWVAVRLGQRAGRWASLDLGDPPGIATGPRLVALGQDFAACRRLLYRAGVRYEALAPRDDGPRCGFTDAVRFTPGGSRGIAFAPSAPGVACPVAAALALWEWNVVQPAALRSFGTPVAAIDQLGSYNCRHIAGRDAWSEHARANAIDIAGFRLTDGRRITVLRDWRAGGPEASFLHAVRAGACPLFATVLSPDYNAAHRDHLHLDQAARGAGGIGGWGWRACR